MSSFKEEQQYLDDSTLSCNDSFHNIPNLHPSRRGSLVPTTAEDESNQDYYCYRDEEPALASSFKDKIETFVGSYSRTSMMHMAENVVVTPSTGPSDHFHHSALLDEEESNLSYTNSHLHSRQQHQPCNKSIHSRRNSEGTLHDERTPLLFPTSASLHKVSTNTSVYTVADIMADNTSLHHLQDHHYHGAVKKSSFIQSIFNSINILVGVGVLALPLGFKYAGWLIGILIFIFCFGLTNYTAKLLAKCLDLDPNSRTYGDMGASAFGVKGRIFISILFLTELTTASVALVVLLSDGIDSLFPGHNPLFNRIISYIILTPTLFIPVRHLSFTSLMGILSAFSLLAVILYDGLSKPHAPGSLNELAEGATSLFPEDWMTVPISFGLIMAGFAGHAVFPTIYRDMKEPRRYKSMVNYTYIVTAIVYMAVAASGYAMFGSETMQEITQNIVSLPGYNQTLNRLAVWLIALNPIAKYGLTLNPVILSWQIGLFGANNGHNSKLESWFHESHWRIPLFKTAGVLLTSAFIVALAGLLPNFDQVMSLLGALFSFLISGIFPICCYLKLFKSSLSPSQKLVNYGLLGVAACMAIIGTVKSFI